MSDCAVNPILILTNPKSGSSMVAGIFRAHGVKGGSDKKKDYVTYESLQIKRAIKPPKTYWLDGSLIESTKEIDTRLHHLLMGFGGKKFIFKAAPEYAGPFLKYEPKIINVRRKKESIVKSMRDDKRAISMIDKRNLLMDSLGGVDVFSDEVVNYRFNTLEKAFDYCELEFNADIAKGVIQKDLWHHI